MTFYDFVETWNVVNCHNSQVGCVCCVTVRHCIYVAKVEDGERPGEICISEMLPDEFLLRRVLLQKQFAVIQDVVGIRADGVTLLPN